MFNMKKQTLQELGVTVIDRSKILKEEAKEI
jgi:hypothetical protein